MSNKNINNKTGEVVFTSPVYGKPNLTDFLETIRTFNTEQTYNNNDWIKIDLDFLVSNLAERALLFHAIEKMKLPVWQAMTIRRNFAKSFAWFDEDWNQIWPNYSQIISEDIKKHLSDNVHWSVNTSDIKSISVNRGKLSVTLQWEDTPFLEYDLANIDQINKARILRKTVTSTAQLQQDTLKSELKAEEALKDVAGKMTMFWWAIIVFYEVLIRTADAADRWITHTWNKLKVIKNRAQRIFNKKIEKIVVNVDWIPKEFKVDITVTWADAKTQKSQIALQVQNYLRKKHIIINPAKPTEFKIQEGYKNKMTTLRDLQWSLNNYSYKEYQSTMQKHKIHENSWEYKSESSFEKAKLKASLIFKVQLVTWDEYKKLAYEKAWSKTKGANMYNLLTEKEFHRQSIENPQKVIQACEKLWVDFNKRIKSAPFWSFLRSPLLQPLLKIQWKFVHYILFPIFFKAIHKNSADIDSYLKTTFEVSAFYSGFAAGKAFNNKLWFKNPASKLLIPLLTAGLFISWWLKAADIIELKKKYDRLFPNNNDGIDIYFWDTPFVDKWKKSFLWHAVSLGIVNDLADWMNWDMHLWINGTKHNLVFFTNNVSFPNVIDHLSERSSWIWYYNKEIDEFKGRLQPKLEKLFDPRIDKYSLRKTIEKFVPYLWNKSNLTRNYDEIKKYNLQITQIIDTVFPLLNAERYQEKNVEKNRKKIVSILLKNSFFEQADDTAECVDALIQLHKYWAYDIFRYETIIEKWSDFSKRLHDFSHKVLPLKWTTEKVDSSSSINFSKDRLDNNHTEIKNLTSKKILAEESFIKNRAHNKMISQLNNKTQEILSRLIHKDDIMWDPSVFNRIEKELKAQLRIYATMNPTFYKYITNQFEDRKSENHHNKKDGTKESLFIRTFVDGYTKHIKKSMDSVLHNEVHKLLLWNEDPSAIGWEGGLKVPDLVLEKLTPLIVGNIHSIRKWEATQELVINEALAHIDELKIDDDFIEKTDKVLQNEKQLIEYALDGKIKNIQSIWNYYIMIEWFDWENSLFPKHSLNSLTYNDLITVSQSSESDRKFFKEYFRRLMDIDRPKLIDSESNVQQEVSKLLHIHWIHRYTNNSPSRELNEWSLTLSKSLTYLIKTHNNLKYNEDTFLANVETIISWEVSNPSQHEQLKERLLTIYRKQKHSYFDSDYQTRFDNSKMQPFFDRLKKFKKQYLFVKNTTEVGDAVNWSNTVISSRFQEKPNFKYKPKVLNTFFDTWELISEVSLARKEESLFQKKEIMDIALDQWIERFVITGDTLTITRLWWTNSVYKKSALTEKQLNELKAIWDISQKNKEFFRKYLASDRTNPYNKGIDTINIEDITTELHTIFSDNTTSKGPYIHSTKKIFFIRDFIDLIQDGQTIGWSKTLEDLVAEKGFWKLMINSESKLFKELLEVYDKLNGQITHEKYNTLLNTHEFSWLFDQIDWFHKDSKELQDIIDKAQPINWKQEELITKNQRLLIDHAINWEIETASYSKWEIVVTLVNKQTITLDQDNVDFPYVADLVSVSKWSKSDREFFRVYFSRLTSPYWVELLDDEADLRNDISNIINNNNFDTSNQMSTKWYQNNSSDTFQKMRIRERVFKLIIRANNWAYTDKDFKQKLAVIVWDNNNESATQILQLFKKYNTYIYESEYRRILKPENYTKFLDRCNRYKTQSLYYESAVIDWKTTEVQHPQYNFTLKNFK